MAVIAPYNVAVVVSAPGEMTITWTNGETYNAIDVEYNAGGGGWHYFDSLVSNETELVTSVTRDVQWCFRISAWVTREGFSEQSDYSETVCETDAIVHHSNTVTGTINLSSSIGHKVTYNTTSIGIINLSSSTSHAVAFKQTVTGTINLTASTSGAKTLKTDYAYYFGTTNGTTHIYSDTYKGDAGVVISCKYETKDTDFAEQDQPSNDKWKTIYAVKLFYEDKSASTEISLSVSPDGGVTWPVSQTQILGTGSDTRKDTTFYFITSGQFFRFKVSSGSASTTFKLLGMEIEYQDAGEHWVTA